jgi:tRNA threonylcarbamoyl adenosine modification protein (Sua5/YciO/YrdC/YwlC family)
VNAVPVLSVNADAPDSRTLADAQALLEAGSLLIYPTETLYALGGRALDADVARRVRLAKGRDEGKPLPLVAADTTQALDLWDIWPERAARLSRAFWPGPLTLVLPARSHVPKEVTGGTGTLALRVPGSRLARDLCARAGPLIATSANRSGDPSPRSCAEAVAGVGPAAALALDGGPCGATASTIVDLTLDAPVLRRAGSIPWEDIRRVLL